MPQLAALIVVFACKPSKHKFTPILAAVLGQLISLRQLVRHPVFMERAAPHRNAGQLSSGVRAAAVHNVIHCSVIKQRLNLQQGMLFMQMKACRAKGPTALCTQKIQNLS